MANTYIVTLVEPVEIPSGALSDIVEHEGYAIIKDGALVFSPGPFDQSTIGYAPGTWLRFEKKEVSP